MPLVQSSSKDAFLMNFLTEYNTGKSVKQALAIAYSIQRKNAIMEKKIRQIKINRQ